MAPDTDARPELPAGADRDACPCDEGRRAEGLSRRRFLGQLGAVGAGGTLAASVGPTAATQVAFAGPAYSGDTLVVLSLRGGFDGLSAVPPVGDPAYAAARPTIAVPAARALRLDSLFGLHPALAPLHRLYADGTLAVVQAVGQRSRTRSHFAAMQEMEDAAPGSGLRTGWLDRMVGLTPAPSTFAAVSLGPGGAPMSLRGPVSEVALSDVDSFTLSTPKKAGEFERFTTALKAMHAASPPVVRNPALATVAASATTRRLAATPYTPANVAAYPAGPLGDALRDVARLIKARVGLRVATVDVGSWDMHVGMGTSEKGWMFEQLTLLGRALAAFAADLQDRLGHVTLVTLSEFGRRVAQNGSGGVDHGHGNACLVLGGGVVGGQVHGRWPGLGRDQLDDGDLVGTTDYRTVLAEVLEKRCGLSTAAIFPDLSRERLGLVRPRG